MSRILSSFRILGCAALVAVLLLAPPLGAMRPAHAGEEVQLTFGDQEVPMEDFLKAVAKVTKQTLVWNPSDKAIRGRTVIGGVSLTAPPGEFLDAIRSFLLFYELVMIPVGPRGHEVILIMDARQSSILLKLKPELIVLTEENLDAYAHKDGLFVTTTIEVEHMQDLRSARNALTRIVTGQNIGNVTEVLASSAFVVTDFAPNVVAIYRLLKQMDHPNATSSTTSAETEAVALQFTKAEDVVAVLNNQFASPQQAGGSRAAQSTAVTPPVAPRIVADERTNRVLVTGTTGDIAAVKAVIALLDISVSKVETQSVVIPLHHIAAAEAAIALSTLTRATQELHGGPRSEMPVVISHQQTNALLVSGSARAIQEIRALLAGMDVEHE